MLALSTARAAETSPTIMCVSPSGAFRIEEGGAGEGDDAWMVSTAAPKQRIKIATKAARGEDAASNSEDEFHLAPNDEWLFGLHHVGSGLRDGDLFHRVGAAKIEFLAEADPFSAKAWARAAKLGAIKRNFSSEGLYAMTFFRGWSADSARLLVQLGGGEEKRSFRYGYLYFNLRTKQFELTDYLRKLNKLEEPPLACAEPIDPLPDEAELKKRFDASDRELNKAYQSALTAKKDQASALRGDQRTWLKDRDAGLAHYLAAGAPEEKERRRLLYLATVNAARIDELVGPQE